VSHGVAAAAVCGLWRYISVAPFAWSTDHSVTRIGRCYDNADAGSFTSLAASPTSKSVRSQSSLDSAQSDEAFFCPVFVTTFSPPLAAEVDMARSNVLNVLPAPFAVGACTSPAVVLTLERTSRTNRERSASLELAEGSFRSELAVAAPEDGSIGELRLKSLTTQWDGSCDVAGGCVKEMCGMLSAASSC